MYSTFRLCASSEAPILSGSRAFLPHARRSFRTEFLSQDIPPRKSSITVCRSPFLSAELSLAFSSLFFLPPFFFNFLFFLFCSFFFVCIALRQCKPCNSSLVGRIYKLFIAPVRDSRIRFRTVVRFIYRDRSVCFAIF